jgi:hypothetical protein
MHSTKYTEAKFFLGQEYDLEGIQAALRGFYDGLSEHDLNMLEANVAPGYYLLEHGEYWNLDYTKYKIGNIKPEGFSRINRFDFKRIEVFGEDAFAVWDLYARVVRDGTERNLYWLESGSFKKIDGNWKVHFLHSTRGTNDQHSDPE